MSTAANSAVQEGTITWAKSAPTATIKKHMAALAKLAVKLDIPLVRVCFHGDAHTLTASLTLRLATDAEQ